MKYIVIICAIFISYSVLGQTNQSLTLDYCYKKAEAGYPVNKQKSLYVESNELKQKNLNSNYLLQLSLNGQATYQSEVTEINIDLPASLPFEINTPDIKKDQYKITLDLNQLIYDGGTINRKKKLEEIILMIDQQGVEIELYKLKERINQVYLYIVLMKESRKIFDLILNEMQMRLKVVQSGVSNGVLLESNSDIMSVEILKMEQKLDEINISISSAISVLSELISEEIPKGTEFILPEIVVDIDKAANNRLDYELLMIHQQRIDAMKNIVTTRDHPKVFGFGSVGYGRPGLDMLSEEFGTFYLVGAKLSWNLWNWNQAKNDQKILDINNEIVNTKIETFDKNIKISIENSRAEIRKLEEMINRDLEIIVLQKKITLSSASQLKNGIITATNYLTELNAEKQALVTLETHKIQLIAARLNYLATLGQL